MVFIPLICRSAAVMRHAPQIVLRMPGPSLGSRSDWTRHQSPGWQEETATLRCSSFLVSLPSLLVDLLGVLDLVVLPVVLLLPRLLAQSQRVAELVKLLAKRFCERLESEHQRE